MWKCGHWSFVNPLNDTRVNMERRWSDIDGEKPKDSEKDLPQWNWHQICFTSVWLYVSIRRIPSVFTNFVIWELCTLDNYIILCGKLYYTNPIIVIIFVWAVSLTLNSLPSCLHIELHPNIFMYYLRKWLNRCSSSSWKLPFYIITLILNSRMHI